MAEETETTETTETPAATAETQQTAETATPAETTKPHPLEPGGERWNEIYRERSEYKRRADALQSELDEARKHQPPAQPQTYSQDQLQQWVDQGKITPAQMAGQLALQAKDMAKSEIRQELRQDQIRSVANAAVNTYLAKLPALHDRTSPEFARVAASAQDIADELGLPVTDLRVQHRALRETFGPPDKLARVERDRDFDRRHADTHTETGGGGGRRPDTKDPLKDVEPARLQHWERLGYTREQMVKEAAFIRRPLRSR